MFMQISEMRNRWATTYFPFISRPEVAACLTPFYTIAATVGHLSVLVPSNLTTTKLTESGNQHHISGIFLISVSLCSVISELFPAAQFVLNFVLARKCSVPFPARSGITERALSHLDRRNTFSATTFHLLHACLTNSTLCSDHLFILAV
jgi:hypothetical protein